LSPSLLSMRLSRKSGSDEVAAMRQAEGFRIRVPKVLRVVSGKWVIMEYIRGDPSRSSDAAFRSDPADGNIAYRRWSPHLNPQLYMARGLFGCAESFYTASKLILRLLTSVLVG
jgi:hypothetical protein